MHGSVTEKNAQNTIGKIWKKISVADLLLEIEKAAVEKQSDLLNKVRLTEAKQERDEPAVKCLRQLRLSRWSGTLTSSAHVDFNTFSLSAPPVLTRPTLKLNKSTK